MIDPITWCFCQMHKSKSRKLLLGNIHVLYNPRRGDVKLGQVSVDISIGRCTSTVQEQLTAMVVLSLQLLIGPCGLKTSLVIFILSDSCFFLYIFRMVC